jgi:ATPase subunit of ABC transporter with duplicated ATPase domains
LNGAGKTTLFFLVSDGTTHQEKIISMEPNEHSFVLRSKTTRSRN